MEFLRELLSESKKDKSKAPVLKMLPIKSFVAGNMVTSNPEDDNECDTDTVTEGKDKVKVPVSKPRAKDINDALVHTKSGRHYDPKRDYVRAKEKSRSRKEMTE